MPSFYIFLLLSAIVGQPVTDGVFVTLCAPEVINLVGHREIIGKLYIIDIFGKNRAVWNIESKPDFCPMQPYG